MIQLASKDSCTGCMVCGDTCSKDAIKTIWRSDGHCYPIIDKHRCIDCGACVKRCPVMSPVQKEYNKPACYIAWSENKIIRQNSSSGGVFGALASFILESGGYVVGVTSEGINVRHIIIDNINDLCKIQGSKYKQGEIQGIYRQVKILLESKKNVLFSGTTCQVNALYKFIGTTNNMYLHTVDLICCGFPSSLLIKRFGLEINSNITSVSYRNKKYGWLVDNKSKSQFITIYSEENKSNEYHSSIILSAFQQHTTHRYSCLNCTNCTLTRNSDITLADAWGDKDFPQEHKDGLSLVLIHTHKGKNIFNSANIISHPIDVLKYIPHNPRITNGKHKYSKLLRILLPYLFKFCSYKSLEYIYGSKSIRNTNILWLPIKVIRFISNKL